MYNVILIFFWKRSNSIFSGYAIIFPPIAILWHNMRGIPHCKLIFKTQEEQIQIHKIPKKHRETTLASYCVVVGLKKVHSRALNIHNFYSYIGISLKTAKRNIKTISFLDNSKYSKRQKKKSLLEKFQIRQYFSTIWSKMCFFISKCTRSATALFSNSFLWFS